MSDGTDRIDRLREDAQRIISELSSLRITLWVVAAILIGLALAK